MNCTSCGLAVSATAVFCGSCGTRVVRETVAPPPPLPPSPPLPPIVAPPFVATPAAIPPPVAPAVASSIGAPPGFITVPPGISAPTSVDRPTPPPIATPVEEDVDATRFNPRAPAAWSLALPDGRRIAVTSVVLVGRGPSQLKAWPGAELVSVDDPDSSVSKTHAAFVLEGGALVVHDLKSTNGVLVTSSAGVETQVDSSLVVGRGSVVEVGTYPIRIE